jgi:hypothetical protein
MNVRQPAILAGGAVLALTIGVGAGVLAVAPVNRAVTRGPGLTAKADLLPAAEAPAATPAAQAPIAVAASAQPAEVRRAEHVQYAQQAARDDQAAIAWPDERSAPAPADEPQGAEEDRAREAPYPTPPPDSQPDDRDPPAYGPGWL